MNIRAKWNSISNHLQRETEIEKAFGLTLRLPETLRLTLEKSFFSNLYGKTFRKIMDLKNIQPDLIKT